MIELPLPDVATRRALWERGRAGRRRLAGRRRSTSSPLTHRVTVGELRAVARARRRGREERVARRSALPAGARSAGSRSASPAPFTLDDLVAPPVVRAALEDLLFEARERLRRLGAIPRCGACFRWAPGCWRCSAGRRAPARRWPPRSSRASSASTSTASTSPAWSASTSARPRATSTACSHAPRGMDVVLFFDEADALFGKRTDIRDAHDRYANTDTNYLLQAVEGYPGIALLATNRKGNVDAAFLRRLRHVLEFPAPGCRAAAPAVGGARGRHRRATPRGRRPARRCRLSRPRSSCRGRRSSTRCCTPCTRRVASGGDDAGAPPRRRRRARAAEGGPRHRPRRARAAARVRKGAAA